MVIVAPLRKGLSDIPQSTNDVPASIVVVATGGPKVAPGAVKVTANVSSFAETATCVTLPMLIPMICWMFPVAGSIRYVPNGYVPARPSAP